MEINMDIFTKPQSNTNSPKYQAQKEGSIIYFLNLKIASLSRNRNHGETLSDIIVVAK